MNSKNQRILIIGAVLCLVFAGFIYYFNNYKIPTIKKSVEADIREEIDINAMPKKKIAVVASEEGISKYTELTEKIINEKIRLVEIPEKFIVKGSVEDIRQVNGKITKEDLRFGEQIVQGSLSEDKKWYEEFQRLKEYQVSSIVADEVKTGNIVDVLVSYGNGYYDVVIPKIKVIKLVTPKKLANRGSQSSNNIQEAKKADELEDNSLVAKGYTLIFAVDEEQYRDMELAKGLGEFETRLYIDENQPPSKKTFDYESAVNKLKTPVVNKKAEVMTER